MSVCVCAFIFQEAKQWAQEQSLPMFTCSAKTGENVKDLFDDLALKVVRRDNIQRNNEASEQRRCAFALARIHRLDVVVVLVV